MLVLLFLLLLVSCRAMEPGVPSKKVGFGEAFAEGSVTPVTIARKRTRLDPLPNSWVELDWQEVPNLNTALDSITVRAGVHAVVTQSVVTQSVVTQSGPPRRRCTIQQNRHQYRYRLRALPQPQRSPRQERYGGWGWQQEQLKQ